MTTALLLTLALAGGERIHPRDEGVNLVFNPTRFAYKHEYKFENLKEEAKSVYFLLPRNCQEHTITSFTYTVAGKALDYKVVSETPGWQVARAEVPPSRNFSVILDVKGVHWNGKLSREKSTLPDDIAPPPISDEKMGWYSIVNPFLGDFRPKVDALQESIGLGSLPSDFMPALNLIGRVMNREFKYVSGAASWENVLNKTGNCNGLNAFLSTVFDTEPSAMYVGVEMNGIIMAGHGEIHAMSMVGKRGWRYLVPTDGVKFDNDANSDPYYLSGHSMGPMLLFMEGLGDAAVDSRAVYGSVVYPVRQYDGGVNVRAPNPGGIPFVVSVTGQRLHREPGKKLSFTQTPVTDFAALRRELAAIQGGNR